MHSVKAPALIRLILCDDQSLVTEGMEMILSPVADIEVVGIAHDGAEAVELVEQLRPDLVLMDLRMPIMNGIHATRHIREGFPETAVLVLTTYDDDNWVFDAIRAGAAGYLLKDTPRERLMTAIRETVVGATHVDPQVAGKLFKQVIQPNSVRAPDADLAAELSTREREVLRHLANGMSNGEIAERLHLTKGTVQNYVSEIFVKLDVTSRTQAAVLALRNGLAE